MKVSIKYKLLFLMVIFPAMSLFLYLLLATNLFEKDKVAYIFDSSNAVVHSLAAQMSAHLQVFVSKAGYIAEEGRGRALLRNEDFDQLELFEHSGNGDWVPSFRLNSFDLPKQIQDLASASEKKALGELKFGSVWFRVLDSNNGYVCLAFLKRNPSAQAVAVTAVFKDPNVIEIFRQSKAYKTFLVDRDGNSMVGPETNDFGDFGKWNFFKSSEDFKESTREIISPSGSKTLVSLSSIPISDLYVVSMVDKKKALEALDILIRKSILFFFGLVATVILFSVLASNYLTSTIVALDEATQRVGKGEFDIDVKVRSRDEIGNLAMSFNRMSQEVKRLLLETAEKARMEKELQVAHTVQETLFPATSFTFGDLDMQAFFEPASECGGDWWYHCEIGDKIFLWIGDVTGHGVPAALLTSAARSAASVIQYLVTITPSRALSIMNKAIYDTSKGKMTMSFFLASLDKKTGDICYCNASHDPPYVARKGCESKSDLITLNEVNNARLGQSPDTVYQEAHLQFKSGDSLILYTDGLIDVRDPEDKPWGERAFLKSYLSALSSSSDAKDAVNRIANDVNQYRKGARLEDDVTLLFCKYG